MDNMHAWGTQQGRSVEPPVCPRLLIALYLYAYMRVHAKLARSRNSHWATMIALVMRARTEGVRGQEGQVGWGRRERGRKKGRKRRRIWGTEKETEKRRKKDGKKGILGDGDCPGKGTEKETDFFTS